MRERAYQIVSNFSKTEVEAYQDTGACIGRSPNLNSIDEL